MSIFTSSCFFKIIGVFSFLSFTFLQSARTSIKDEIDKATRNVVALHISTKTPNPSAVMKYNEEVRSKGWNIHHSSHFKILTGTKKVIIAQSKVFLDPGVYFNDSPPITCRELKSSLAPIISSAEFVSFAEKHRLDPEMLTVPKLCQTVYSRLIDDKEMFSDLLEAYKEPSHALYAISGSPLVSLLAITLKIKHPRVPQKLIVFGNLPEYTHDFLSALRIPYENHSSPRQGFPEVYDKFMADFS